MEQKAELAYRVRQRGEMSRLSSFPRERDAALLRRPGARALRMWSIFIVAFKADCACWDGRDGFDNTTSAFLCAALHVERHQDKTRLASGRLSELHTPLLSGYAVLLLASLS